MIQNFQKYKQRKFLSNLSKDAVKRRKEANLSYLSTDLVNNSHINESTHYKVPGIVQQSAQFVRATQQTTMFCTGEQRFSPADCLMLCMVLRSPACAIRTLILHEIDDAKNPCFEFDLLAALRKCSCVRSVYILGGEWNESFIQALVQVVHVDNPRITTLVLEQIRRVGAMAEALANNVGRMLLDYFNYSIPGLSELTLHGCTLGDSNLALITSGIAVNSSIKSLTLSLNLIEDAGFVKIFKALNSNKKSKIEKLDFSYNLLQGNREYKKLLLEYKPHDIKINLLIVLVQNRIYEYYHPVNDLINRGTRAAAALT